MSLSDYYLEAFRTDPERTATSAGRTLHVICLSAEARA